MNKKIVAIILMIFGAALLFGAVTFWIDTLTSTEPAGLGVNLRDWLTTIAGLVTCVIGVMEYVKNNKKGTNTEIKVIGGSPQIAMGEHAKNVWADMYIDKQVIEAPKIIPSIDNPQQLPSPPADFTGRKKEILEINKEIRRGVSIINLHGMSGVGKTALGLVIANKLKRKYPTGQIFIDLQSANKQEALTPTQVMSHVLHSFNPEARLPEDETALLALYRTILTGKKVLLFFDNVSGPEQVEPLLPHRECLLLVTSQLQFNLPGQAEHNLKILTPRDAREFISKVTKSVKPEDADAIAKQCGYLPLALRLSAGLLNTRRNLTPEGLTEKLKNSPALLAPVEASLQLSYEQLDHSLRLPFCQLGVFTAPFHKLAVKEIWEIDQEETDEYLGILLQANMLEYRQDIERFSLHNLVRGFVLNQLSTAQKEHVSYRHAKYYLFELSQLNGMYKEGYENILKALSFYDKEAENIKTGQTWAAKNNAQLANVYLQKGIYILDLRLTTREKIDWEENALKAARQMDDVSSECSHLLGLGMQHSILGEFHEAIKRYEEALRISRETNNSRMEINVLGMLGYTCTDIGEANRAIAFSERQLVLAHEFGDNTNESDALCNLGRAYSRLGNNNKAIECYLGALANVSESGNKHQEVKILVDLGLIYNLVGRIPEAIECYERALVITGETGDWRSTGMILGALANTLAYSGQKQKALVFFSKQLTISRKISDRQVEGMALNGLGFCLYDIGNKKEGIKIVKQALTILEAVESPTALDSKKALQEWGVKI